MSSDSPARKRGSDGETGRSGSTAVRRQSRGLFEATVYKPWCEKSQSFVNGERFVVFRTIGRAPVESPPHPARLTPVREMASTWAAGSSPRSRARTSSNENHLGETAGADGSAASPRPRTFPLNCGRVLGEQGAVQAFNPQRIYLACEFFSVCSRCFVRELVASGEPPLWQGITFDSKAVIYSEGDSGTSMYVVVRGVAEVVSKGREPRELRTHDYFGEAQALGVLAERQETVRAKTSLHALEVSCATLTNLLRRERAQDLGIDGLSAPPSSSTTPVPPRGGPSRAQEAARRGSLLSAPTSSSRSASPQPRVSGGSSQEPPSASRTPRQMPRCISASQRFYAFAKERKHFEHLASQLYQELVRRHHSPGRRAPAASPRAAAPPSPSDHASSIAEEEGGRRSASSSAAGARVWPPADEASNLTPRGRCFRRERSKSSEFSPLDRKKASKRNAAAAAAHVSGVDNPKLWRKHLEEVQLLITEGDTSDDGNGRDRFVQRLTDSIRSDMRRGYMMPADLGKVRKNMVSGSSSQARSPVMWHSAGGGSPPSPRGSAGQTLGRRRHEPEEESPGEEEDLSGEAHLLDLRLLPPLGLMNARQKHALLQQMQRQAKLASRSQNKAHIRQRVASTIHLAGLSKFFVQKKLSATRLAAGAPTAPAVDSPMSVSLSPSSP